MTNLNSDMEKAPDIFNVSLTVYSLLKKKASRGVSSRVKTSASTAVKEKSVKVKELVFSINNNNYNSFLTSLLEKHGQEQYKVSADCRFPFKYHDPSSEDGPPPRKKITYEKHFHKGGGCRFTGPPMEPGNEVEGIDYDLYYNCEMHRRWLPVPKGFVVVEDSAEDFKLQDNVFF